eukprot:364802-Chlamydomonas_euryale.AAC.4
MHGLAALGNLRVSLAAGVEASGTGEVCRGVLGGVQCRTKGHMSWDYLSVAPKDMFRVQVYATPEPRTRVAHLLHHSMLVTPKDTLRIEVCVAPKEFRRNLGGTPRGLGLCCTKGAGPTGWSKRRASHKPYNGEGRSAAQWSVVEPKLRVNGLDFRV